jgi:hypothetical protein
MSAAVEGAAAAVAAAVRLLLPMRLLLLLQPLSLLLQNPLEGATVTAEGQVSGRKSQPAQEKTLVSMEDQTPWEEAWRTRLPSLPLI